MATSAKELLQKTKVKDLIADKEQSVILLWSNMKLDEALQLMREKGITSAPVKKAHGTEYIGMFSVLDAVKYAIEAVGGFEVLKKRDFEEFLSLTGEAFFTSPLEDIVGTAQEGPFPYIPMRSINASVYSLFTEVFAKEIHRVPVADEFENIIYILSQSRAVGWLHGRMQELGTRGHEKIQDLGLVTGSAISVSSKMRALEALKVIMDNKVQGVCVVDDSGVVVGSFSASDLKYMTADTFPYLIHSVEQFIGMMRARQQGSVDPLPLPKPITCKPTHSLWNVVNKIVKHRVHRVFIVDEERKPQGVVTLTNVIEALLV